MFKKTPIALAILALSATMTVANADGVVNDCYIDETQREALGFQASYDGGVFYEITAKGNAVGQKVTIHGVNNGKDKPALAHRHNNQIYVNGFTDLELISESDRALRYYSGNLGFGLKYLSHEFSDGTPERITTFAPLNSLTIHSDTQNAIRGRGFTTDNDDVNVLGQGTAQVNIVAKHVSITSNSKTEAAIDLKGIAEKGNVDYDGAQIDILRYDETTWERVDDKGWTGNDTEGKPIIDNQVAKYYGVFDDAEKMQTTFVSGVNMALRLRDGSSFSVDAGAVEIQGNIVLKNGSVLSLGQTTNGLSLLPDAWVEWDSDAVNPDGSKGAFVPDEAPGEGYIELINSVDIRGKILPTENNNHQAAIHVEGGSLVFVAANDVSISGTVIPNEHENSSSSNNGQNRKPVNEFFKKVKDHFGSDFRLLYAWQDQLDQHGHDGLVQYGNAIYLLTDKASQYQQLIEKDENGKDVIKDTAIPSIVSIWGEKKLEINGDIVLDFKDHYSGSLLYIGADKDAKVLINGDIVVKNDPNGEHVNTIKLDLHKDHLFIGSIIDISDAKEEQQAMFRMMRAAPVNDTEETVEINAGTHLSLLNNHSTILTGDSVITSVKAENSSIMTVDTPSVTIKNLNLAGDLDFYTFDVKAKQFKIENLTVGSVATYALKRDTTNTPSLGFVVANMKGKSDAEVAKLVSIENIELTDPQQKTFTYTLTQNEGGQLGGKRDVFAEIQEDGSIKVSGHQEDNTTVSKAINDVAGLGIMAWRAQMNDVNKRLGDLRTYQGQYGGWARVYGSETKYGDLGLKSESNTVQVGADMKIADNFYFGATASYTDGKGKLNNGTTDDRAYSFGVYGGWMGDDGQFVDVIIKEHNFKTDFDLRYTTGERSTGDFDLWGTSICAEYGWRLNVADGFWVEPQAEMTYGYMNDVTYEYAGGVKATQEATESLVGRLGVAFGSTFENGSAYAKASVAHDWMSETEISMSNGNAPMKEDLGGTWGEFAIGGTYNFANGWAVYGEFQTAKGSKMKTPYQYNIGARYVF